MQDTRVRFALDNFIAENYFLKTENQYHLKEERDSGKSDLTLRIGNENLCLYDFDNKGKCNFLRTEKDWGCRKVWIMLYLRRGHRMEIAFGRNEKCCGIQNMAGIHKAQGSEM